MKRIIIAAFTVLTLPACASAQAGSELETMWREFKSVPDSTRTKVWWFHGETETTREGITADLEAFKNAGVGGVVYYDQVHGKGGSKALDAFTPEWWQMFVFAASEAKRLGLTFEPHLSNGYVAGGPWITPALSMKTLLSSDTVVKGGSLFKGTLKLPPTRLPYHEDVAVLAFPKPCSGWVRLPLLSGKKTFQGGQPGRHYYITYDAGRVITARSLSYQVNGRIKTATRSTNIPGPPAAKFYGTGWQELPPLGELEVSDDGKAYRKAASLKPFYNANTAWKRTAVAFPAATGRYFRLNLHDWWPQDAADKNMRLADVLLSTSAVVDQWPVKAGLVSDHLFTEDTPLYAQDEVIDPSTIINLTDRLCPDGHLEWQIPPGEWVIMRFISAPTGALTKHGRPNLMGLECDKMSSFAAETQWLNYYKVMSDTLKRHGLRIDGLAMDSHEAGAQNWTAGFEREFQRLRGYDLTRFLPVMAGYVVDNTPKSAAILYDVRRTVADLISEKYFATLDSLTSQDGIRFTAQAVGNGLAITGDPIQAKGRVDKPQGEFWAHHPDGNYDIKECSSAAHLYGKLIASGEAFTDLKYSHSPAYAKTLADYGWCYGLNEYVVCASAYQPWLGKTPGNTAGGRQYCLNRNNTYWPYLRPFWDYQSRCAYMMRQGKPVNDLCLYIGENAPVKLLSFLLPDIPGGTDFDAFTSDALFSRMQAGGGRITLPDGHSYGLMVLPRGGEITFRALTKIASMVSAGAHVYGSKPKHSPTAEDCSAGQKARWRELVNGLWGTDNAKSGTRSYGLGTITWGVPLVEAMRQAGITPDIDMQGDDIKARKVWFAHRQTAQTDIYFINNHSHEAVSGTFTLRSPHRKAEWWDAVNGIRHALRSSVTASGRTSVELVLAANEAGILVLSDCETDGLLPVRQPHAVETAAPVEGEWTVFFDPKMGGSGMKKARQLTDWTSSADRNTRYYSGTAVYENTFRLARHSKKCRTLLRFSRLGDVARVYVNSNEAGIVWCSPWELDITPYVKRGKNTLRIDVANSLMNRIALDNTLPEAERVTYAVPALSTEDYVLRPSGIIGPVMVVSQEQR